MMVTFRNFQRIHLIGIGGSGMSGIAEVLLSSGYAVSGSDTKPSAVTVHLEGLGAKIFEGHNAANVRGAHVVVVSSAVKQDNSEVAEAHRLKIPVIPRAEMLAELMRLKYGIAVAGAHGKTTTTSMTASVLAAAGLDPTFVVGGRVNHAGANARVGLGEYIVVEADESDRSFLLLAPVIAVVTTIDREHLDHYSSLEEIQHTFLQFVNRVPFYGAVILCLDEPNVQTILPDVKRPVITYGTSSQADLVISDVKLEGMASTFRLTYHGDDLGQFHLNSPPGIHNVRNAAAAAAARRAAAKAQAADPGRPRFVAGALGPLNRTLSMSPDVNRPDYRAVTWDQVVGAYLEQARALAAGGVDALLVETIFDTLNAKAALFAIETLFDETGVRLPVMVSVTVTDASGRTLSGQTIGAFYASIAHARPFSVGINCALGGRQMRPYVEELSSIAPCFTSCYPNAGLPNAFGGYDETPADMAAVLGEFAANGWLNMAGGCCGSTPAHIAAIAGAVRPFPPRGLPRQPPAMHLSGLETLVIT